MRVLKQIDFSKRVYVYFNLHKMVWSVKQSGIVVAHAEKLHLRSCRFLVAPAGNALVRKTGKKEVHAGVSGYLVKDVEAFRDVDVTYNPFKYTSFVRKDNKAPIKVADSVYMDCTEGRVVTAKNVR